MYYIRALIYDFLSGLLYVYCIGGVAMCVGDHVKGFYFSMVFFNTGAAICPKTTEKW